MSSSPKNNKRTKAQKQAELIQQNQLVRQKLVRDSHELFARTYLGHYFTHPFAEFHTRLLAYTEDPDLRFLAGVAFRNSGKTTLVTVSYPMWSIVGKPQKKCVLIIGQTQKQARQYLTNIKDELTNNPLLVADLGPFEEQDEEWNSGAIVIKQYGAKIIALSREQSIRGLRHLQNRPDLIICDDVEDIESTRTQESRDANYEWFTSEVIPCGDEKTQYAFIGNLVNEDCILERLRAAIEESRIDGAYFRIPLLDEHGDPTWPERYPDKAAIEKLRRTVPNDSAWQREYMLNIVDDGTRLLRREQIQYYDQLPSGTPRLVVLGTDLAISDKLTADFTSLVAMVVYGYGKKRRIYVLPGVINAHMMLHEAIKKVVTKADLLKDRYRTVEVLIEDVGFQKAVYDELRQEGIRATQIPLRGMSKRERLELPASYVDMGQVLFPKVGAEVLVDQLVNFGYGGHDDLCDAFSIGVNHAVGKTRSNHIRMTTGDLRHINPPREFDEEEEEAKAAEAEDRQWEEREIYVEERAKERRKMGLPEKYWYVDFL